MTMVETKSPKANYFKELLITITFKVAKQTDF